jgi:porin
MRVYPHPWLNRVFLFLFLICGVRWSFVGIVAALAIGLTTTAAAQSPGTNYPRQRSLQKRSSQNGLLKRSTLTGNWGGTRSQLKNEYGLDLFAGYTGEYALSLSGGDSGAGDDAYAQQVKFGADFDLEPLFGWQGGTFHLLLNYREGDSLSADSIGGTMNSVQEVYGAGQNFRLTDLSYSQKFADDAFEVQVGFYPAGSAFGAFASSCKFQSGLICGNQKTMTDESGWNNYPTGQWGGRLQWNFMPNAYVQAGAFSVDPDAGTSNHGFELGGKQTGVVFPVEFDYTTHFAGGSLPGEYKIGGYYDTSKADDVKNTDKRHRRYGGYLLMRQTLVSFDGTAERGLEFFVQGSFANTETSVFSNAEAAGFIVRGPFKSRRHDYIAIGYFREGLNHRKRNAVQAKRRAVLGAGNFQSLSHAIDSFEINYAFQATPWFLVRPNIQYQHNPGTFVYRHIHDVWVFGLSIQMDL